MTNHPPLQLHREAYMHDLTVIEQMSMNNEEENEQFRSFLKQQDSEQLDQLVHQLNIAVSEAIDCRLCGNCCRSLMINVLPHEADELAAHLNMPTADFKNNFVEESEQGQLIINSIPCRFLEDNKCSIYDHRFHECREFPHLHKTGFINRLFGTFMHYERCPIIFNVIELLKTKLPFIRQNEAVSPVMESHN